PAAGGAEPAAAFLARNTQHRSAAGRSHPRVGRVMNKPVEIPATQAHGVVGRALPHESARLHVAGEATYVDDMPEVAGTLHAAPHRIAGTFEVGGQEQFYLEGQISYAVPREDRGLTVHCSTQHPSEMQHLVARALGLNSHHVQVECRRMGGGFGGKESQSAVFACIAAVAASRLARPVKLRLDRDDDFLVTGRRHCFHYDYEVGYDDDGRVLGAELTMISRAG